MHTTLFGLTSVIYDCICLVEMQNLQTSALGQLAHIRAEAIMMTKVYKS